MKGNDMIKKILLYIWQLPQNILGLFIIALSKVKRHSYCGYWVCSIMPGYGHSTYKWSAISLGNYIISSKELSPATLDHERGHQVQSKYLGPLYLIAVGIPSFFRAIYKNLFNKDNYWYHSGYPENWADKLGRQLYYEKKRS